MGRGDESDAGIKLIQELKAKKSRTPIVVYASLAAIENYGKLAFKLGAREVVNGISDIISIISEVVSEHDE